MLNLAAALVRDHERRVDEGLRLERPPEPAAGEAVVQRDPHDEVARVDQDSGRHRRHGGAGAQRGQQRELGRSRERERREEQRRRGPPARGRGGRTEGDARGRASPPPGRRRCACRSRKSVPATHPRCTAASSDAGSGGGHGSGCRSPPSCTRRGTRSWSGPGTASRSRRPGTAGAAPGPPAPAAARPAEPSGVRRGRPSSAARSTTRAASRSRPRRAPGRPSSRRCSAPTSSRAGSGADGERLDHAVELLPRPPYALGDPAARRRVVGHLAGERGGGVVVEQPDEVRPAHQRRAVRQPVHGAGGVEPPGDRVDQVERYVVADRLGPAAVVEAEGGSTARFRPSTRL